VNVLLRMSRSNTLNATQRGVDMMKERENVLKEG
jgi:hypothetical protein